MKEKSVNIIAEVCSDETIKYNRNIDLLENDLLDSLAFINLISKLEDEFDIEIQLTQIRPETWRNVNMIINMVKSYRGGG